MHQVNARGTFLVSKTCLPWLKQAENPHILMLSPPLNMVEKWFAPHVAYSMAKYGMSMCVLGMAGEFRELGPTFLAAPPAIGIIQISSFPPRVDMNTIIIPSGETQA